MSLDTAAGRPPSEDRARIPWGALSPVGEVARVLRVVLPDRTVSFPYPELSRWEHVLGPPEQLVIMAGHEEIIVDGSGLGLIHLALDLSRIIELRRSDKRALATHGAVVTGLRIEIA